MDVIEGPVAPLTGGPIYQVTLASGMIVTSPKGFGVNPDEVVAVSAVVSADGRVLVVPEPGSVSSQGTESEAPEPSDEYQRFEDLARGLLQVSKDDITA